MKREIDVAGGAGPRRAVRRRMSTDERRSEIVAIAAEQFDVAGYTNTSMDEIAQAVGIAKATLYHYFASKDEILHSIHEAFIDLLIARHSQRLQAGILSEEQLLLEVMADILELMETHRGHVRVFFEHHRELPDGAREAILTKRDQYEAMVEDIIVRGIASGAFRETDPHLAALAAFGMCNWAYQWYRSGGGLDHREIAYRFWGYLVQGLGAPKA
jgi:AcrR family transcriptional regulator